MQGARWTDKSNTHHSHFRCRGGQQNVGGGGNKEKAEPLLRTTDFFFVPSRASFFLRLLFYASLASFFGFFLLFLATCNHNRRSPEEKRNAHSALSRIWISVSPKSASFKPLALFSIITQRGRLLNSKSSIFTYGAYQQLCRTATHQACDISSTI